MRRALLTGEWCGRFLIERHIDLVVERIVAALVDVVRDTEW